ncbi:MAG: N-acylglucosamine 2-epimerase [Ruminococcus sp.]|nr:N-acylglucosamine 2-epimerase [Ruminococcus sp.]
MLKDICKDELEKSIIPFWNKLKDARGGFYGQVTLDLDILRDAPKGVILHSRILWFYSAAYNVTGNKALLEYAEHAFNFISEKCYDNEFGGVYWMMDAEGEPFDDMKHTYNQAFAIYGLAEYYKASGNEKARALALRIFDDIETKAVDEYGYMEAFTRNWFPKGNEQLSENGLQADKTMNTTLHIMEAYTELYRITKSEKVGKRLQYALDLMTDKVYDKDNHMMKVFFNRRFELIGDIHSYGHDIEASWLIDRACEVLGSKEYSEKTAGITADIAGNILDIAYENNSLNNERDGENINKNRIWWVQAEAVVGFVNAYQRTGEKKYLDAAQNILEYIMKYQKDKREGSEWFPELEPDGTMIKDAKDPMLAGPWKCPYHNGRMCLEIIKRNVD